MLVLTRKLVSDRRFSRVIVTVGEVESIVELVSCDEKTARVLITTPTEIRTRKMMRGESFRVKGCVVYLVSIERPQNHEGYGGWVRFGFDGDGDTRMMREELVVPPTCSNG